MSIIHKFPLSPFLEGLARTFDFAGSFDETIPPLSDRPNPVADDWNVISKDYNKSLTIIDGEINDEPSKLRGK
jgi:transposase